MSKIYSFYGPVYRFGELLGIVKEENAIVTEANSFDKAYSNILFRLKRHFEIPDNWLLTIDKNKIEIKDKYIPDDVSDLDAPEKCLHCGTQLNSMGECPICDYEEYDLLDSAEAMKFLSGMQE